MRTLDEIKAAAKAACDAALSKDQNNLPEALNLFDRVSNPPTVLQLLDLLDEMAGALEKRQIFERESGNIVKSMAGVTVCFSDVLQSEINALEKYNAWKKEK